MTLTSFPKGIHNPFEGASARNFLASWFSGRSGMQSSGLSYSS
jgi:hypothetical protein